MKNKLNVFVLGKLPPPYFGPAITTEILINSDLQNNYHLTHIDTQANENISDVGKWKLNKIYRNLLVYVSLIKEIHSKQPALLIIPISQSMIGFIKDSIFIWIAVLMNKKVLINFLGGEFDSFVSNSPGWFKFHIKKTLKKCAGVVVLGHNLKKLFEPYFNEKSIHVIPNGADFIIPKPTKNNNKLHLIFVANLRKRKGILETIQAISNLKGIDFELTIVGSWQQESVKQKCISLINELKLPVTILSNITHEHKLNLLGNADIFIFPPNEPEGHPWVLVEALAAGLPIISTNQGAIIESVLDGENGFIVASNSYHEITDKLNFLISNVAIREQMGLKSKELYENHFKKRNMIEGFDNCIKKILCL